MFIFPGSVDPVGSTKKHFKDERQALSFSLLVDPKNMFLPPKTNGWIPKFEKVAPLQYGHLC